MNLEAKLKKIVIMTGEVALTTLALLGLSGCASSQASENQHTTNVKETAAANAGDLQRDTGNFGKKVVDTGKGIGEGIGDTVSDIWNYQAPTLLPAPTPTEGIAPWLKPIPPATEIPIACQVTPDPSRGALQNAEQWICAYWNSSIGPYSKTYDSNRAEVGTINQAYDRAQIDNDITPNINEVSPPDEGYLVYPNGKCEGKVNINHPETKKASEKWINGTKVCFLRH